MLQHFERYSPNFHMIPGINLRAGQEYRACSCYYVCYRTSPFSKKWHPRKKQPGRIRVESSPQKKTQNMLFFCCPMNCFTLKIYISPLFCFCSCRVLVQGRKQMSSDEDLCQKNDWVIFYFVFQGTAQVFM